MATISAIATALASTIQTGTGVPVSSFVPGNINPPQAFLSLGEITEETFGYGSMEIPFDLVVLVSKNDDAIGQGNLYDLASPSTTTSVWAVLAADQDLSLNDASRARVLSYRPLGIEEIGAYGFFGGVFAILVTSPGT